MSTPVKKTIELFYDVISPYSWIAFEVSVNSTQLKFITTLWSVDQIAQLITTHESRVHKMKNNEHEMSIARYYT